MPVASVSRILIDGGPAPTYQLPGLRRRIELLPQNARMLELFVVTHIDADHIDGALILLQELMNSVFRSRSSVQRMGPAAQDRAQTFAPLQGEFLGGVITLDNTLRQAWNRSFGGKAVATPETGNLTEIKMPGGAKSLLGPTAAELKRLRARWASAIHDFSPGDADVEACAACASDANTGRRRPRRRSGHTTTETTRAQASEANIAFVFEINEVAILFHGDADARPRFQPRWRGLPSSAAWADLASTRSSYRAPAAWGT